MTISIFLNIIEQTSPPDLKKSALDWRRDHKKRSHLWMRNARPERVVLLIPKRVPLVRRKGGVKNHESRPRSQRPATGQGPPLCIEQKKVRPHPELRSRTGTWLRRSRSTRSGDRHPSQKQAKSNSGWHSCISIQSTIKKSPSSSELNPLKIWSDDTSRDQRLSKMNQNISENMTT